MIPFLKKASSSTCFPTGPDRGMRYCTKVVHEKKKFNRGEICVANFISPWEWGIIGELLGNYFLLKSHKLAVFEEKQAYKNSSGSQTCKLFFNWFLVLVRWKVKYWVKMLLFLPWPWPYRPLFGQIRPWTAANTFHFSGRPAMH